jgi:Flp pilus assembly CpaE family ATPase
MRAFAFRAGCCAAVISVTPAQSFAGDRCQQLESLAQQYAGVELTTYQKQLKAKMVAWYGHNCRGRRSAEN